MKKMRENAADAASVGDDNNHRAAAQAELVRHWTRCKALFSADDAQDGLQSIPMPGRLFLQ